MKIGQKLVATTDNAAGIGEKAQDVVNAPDQLTSYLTARVTFLEQLAANAITTHVFLANFSSEDAWGRYVEGIQKVFDEVGLVRLRVDGSSESNIDTLQSGLSITMLGEIQECTHFEIDELHWYTYGVPLVGIEVVEQSESVAKIQPIFDAWLQEIVMQVWPVGSNGLQAEFKRLFGDKTVECSLDVDKSAGPSTVILLGIHPDKKKEAKQIFTKYFEKIHISQ